VRGIARDVALWIFGYGSLLWRPDLPGDPPPRVGLVRGWERRLDQGSPDHRGVPERLGRVATLVPTMDAACWGAAFEVDDVDASHALETLDYRERGGYVRAEVDVALRDDLGRTVRAVTWVASPENPFYLGPTSLEAMVSQIAAAAGPSGTNRDYVLKLAATLRAWDLADAHVFALERALRAAQ